MATPYLAEIRIFSFDFAPKGWAICGGQLLPINQNQALFSLLGTNYGGNGSTNFALPDLRGRVPLHFSQSIGLGQKSGEENHTLTVPEIPAHSHVPNGSNAAPDVPSPVGNFWAGNTTEGYSNTADGIMSPAAIGNNGGNQGHENRSPYLAVTICIALQGIYPSRN